MDVPPDPAGPLAVVVGAGITGLTAAWRLGQRGVRTVVFEATHRTGGQIRTVPFAGMPFDMGAEAVHLAVPGMPGLLDELGLTQTAVRSGPGGTWLGTAHGLRRLPAGVGPYGPTRLGPVVRSGILTPWGLARAGIEPVLAHRAGPASDVSVHAFVSARFGHEVAERLVDPMLGGLHSGDIRALSLAAAAPQLAVAARERRSLTLSRSAARARRGGAPSAFVTWEGGLGTLPERIGVRSGAEVRLSTPVRCVTREGGRYAVFLAEDPAPVRADAVVLAVPSRVAAGLLTQLSPTAADALGGQRFATVATVAAAFPRQAAGACRALSGTGILMPSTSPRVLKAATFFGTKWPHLAGAQDYLLRMSAGRVGSRAVDDLDDAALVAALLGDLRDLTGLTAYPSQTLVQRWPQGLGQLEVGHLDRLAAAREALARHPGIALAGASYDGIGIGACVQSAAAAAVTVSAGWT
ncbi:MAG: protoporphyrinogen oxidase [Dermatophilaceae bacterium]